MDPSIRRMIGMARGDEGGTPAFGALAAKVDTFGPILTLLGLVIIVMMIWKPGSGWAAFIGADYVSAT